jgi:hypothetical protein
LDNPTMDRQLPIAGVEVVGGKFENNILVEIFWYVLLFSSVSYSTIKPSKPSSNKK